MANTRRNERSWRTDKGPLSTKLADEFNKTLLGVNDGYTVVGLPPTVSTAASLYTWSYGVTFSAATAISIAATAFGTVSGVGIRTGSVATTQSVFSTSAAGVTFSAIAFGPV